MLQARCIFLGMQCNRTHSLFLAYVRTHIHVHAHIHAYMHTSTKMLGKTNGTHIYIYTHKYVYTYIHISTKMRGETMACCRENRGYLGIRSCIVSHGHGAYGIFGELSLVSPRLYLRVYFCVSAYVHTYIYIYIYIYTYMKIGAIWGLGHALSAMAMGLMAFLVSYILILTHVFVCICICTCIHEIFRVGCIYTHIRAYMYIKHV